MSLFNKPIVHNAAVCKLGRSRVRVDSRTLYLAKYIRPEILDPPPASVDWTAKVFAAYCDEAYAPLSPDWIGANGLDPAGLDLVALQTDLQAVAA